MASAVILGSLAPLVLFIAPLLIGAMVNELKLTPSQAGLIISAHLGGIGLSGAPSAFLVKRRIWRPMMLTGVVAIAALFAAAAFAKAFMPLILTLFAAGMAGGLITSLALPTMGMSAWPGRAFAFWVVAQLVFGAAGVAILPALIAITGLTGVFLAIAGLMVCLLPLVPFTPQGPPAATIEASSGAQSTPMMLWSAAGLMGLLAFYIAIGSVWTYFERIGNAAGLASGSIALALSVATLAGVGGALAAAATPSKVGELAPIAAGMVLLALAIVLLVGLRSLHMFTASAIVFKVAWTFTLPFLLACLSRIGRAQALLVLANITIGGGLAAGPAIAAALLQGGGYDRVIALGFAGLLLAASIFVSLALKFRPSTAKGAKPAALVEA